MGWWWSTRDSSQVVAPAPIAQNTLPSLNQEQQRPPQSDDIPEPVRVEPQKRALTREEQGDRELIEWLKEIQAETGDSGTHHNPFNPITASSQPVPEDISPDSLYPTEISCRSAFDYAFFCQSFGGQFVNVYRYGGFRSCSNHWDDFWLCMRTRQWDKNDRKTAIQEHYRKKAIKYKTGRSSEDVWQVRTDVVKDAFQGNLEELEKQIEDWKQANPDIKAPWEKSM